MHAKLDAFVFSIGLLAAGVLAVGWLMPILSTQHFVHVAAGSASSVPAAVPAVASQGADPAGGPWLLEGRSSITLEADHAIAGDRRGNWRYTCTTNAGRNYELHWPPPKDWVDYLVLSEDGKTLDGKTRNNRPITYFRP